MSFIAPQPCPLEPGPPGPPGASDRVLRFVLDGGGNVISTGAKRAYMTIPFTCTISKVRVLADQIGDIVIDIWDAPFTSYPPTIVDSITAADKPTLSSAIKSEDSLLTGWTTTLNVGDILEIHVDSVTTVTKVYLDLFVNA